VRPYCWFAAFLLFLSYVIGLWFTLRTHAAVIWNTEVEEKKDKLHESQHFQREQQLLSSTPFGRHQKASGNISNQDFAQRNADIRNSQMYKKILGQSLKQAGLKSKTEPPTRRNSSSRERGETAVHSGESSTPHLVPPKSADGADNKGSVQIPGLTNAQNVTLIREVAAMAATAATMAARDAIKTPRKGSQPNHLIHGPFRTQAPTVIGDLDMDHEAAGGGHDAPNWSRAKSSIILMGATILYAIIAEILVSTVDVVLQGVAVDEKFLGITLFALVPNTTEFLVSHKS
jgi:Ca2+:H+ antiporter